MFSMTSSSKNYIKIYTYKNYAQIFSNCYIDIYLNFIFNEKFWAPTISQITSFSAKLINNYHRKNYHNLNI